jgi:hypothetical protein
MRNAPHVSVLAGAFEVQPFAAAVGVIAICALLIGLAFSLPGRAAEGVVLGIGSTLASMLDAAHPGRTLVPLVICAATALACTGLWIAGGPSPGRELAPTIGQRVREWSTVGRIGGFWLAVPAIALVVIDDDHPLGLAVMVGVFTLVWAAARRRGRDLSVGYAAGVLVCLAGLAASAYGQAAGDGAVLAYPADLTGLAALGCAARIGLDRAFTMWQRLAALSIGAATLVAVASAVAFTAAAVAGGTYLVCRLRAPRMPRQLGDAFGVSVVRAVMPLVVVAALWMASVASVPRGRGTADFGSVSAFGSAGLFGTTSSDAYAGTGVIGVVALVAGAALVVWRVTGPGLPVWVPVVGLAALAGVLAGGAPAAFGPSPAWVFALGAELWVFCHGLRPDRNVTPAPQQVDRA